MKIQTFFLLLQGYLAKLLPGESLKFIIQFIPIEYGFFKDSSLIILKDIKKNTFHTPYNYIRFFGMYRKPTLNFSSPLVSLVSFVYKQCILFVFEMKRFDREAERKTECNLPF